MFSFFSTNPDPSDPTSLTGYSCIFSLYNQTKNQTIRKSRVDHHFFQNFIRHPEELLKSNLDKRLIELLLEEYTISGPPEPIELSDAPTHCNTNPFSFKWDPFEIRQYPDCFSILFDLKEYLSKIEFTLRPSDNVEILSDTLDSVPTFRGMQYLFNPNLTISGHLGHDKIKGEAWFDHQWGDLSWFSNDDHSVMGWDWFGINFDNGSQLLVVAHRKADSREQVAGYAVLKAKNKKIQFIPDIKIIPLRFWRSTVTSIEYPVELMIELTESSSLLRFIPYTDHQEIQFFGPLRAIWQGAGTISGQLMDETVFGHARCELNGYGFIFDFRQFIDSLGQKIDTVIEGFFPRKMTEEVIRNYAGSPHWKYEPHAYDTMLAEPVWNLISRNGKRWRSVFARLLLSSLGTNPEPFEELLYSITELNHTGSLIIDDIEDNSLIRRGKECIHLLYGSDLAINAANTIYFLPNLLLYRHPELNSEQKLEINELITKGFIQGHLGQGLDLYWSRHICPENLHLWLQDSTDEKILQMYALKTAAGIRGLAETASIIAKKDAEIRDVCGDYAMALGVAFQILDDVHNFSASDNWKKIPGEDIAEGKLTFVIFQTIKMLNGNERKFFTNILGSPDLRKDKEMISKCIALVTKSGALEYSRSVARKMIEPKWDLLSTRLPFTDQRLLLKILTFWLLEMEYK